ncbi:ABC transporter ATP-binding protein [Aquibium carbonis]|uniref:ABC transporter ATP-binding protein n=1 Tax=Aquibium carbonis TaxID=2495581 RepID=A0A3R9YH62_9HYPH|nr:ABC transporter ATP-binding protein [Aquibium carbonis]
MDDTETRRVKQDEIISLLLRIFRENGRDYIGTYSIAVACLLAVAATTAFSAWIMNDVVNSIFYERRYDLVAIISGSIALAFIIRGLATYMQSVLLSKVGNNLVARYQRRIFDHLMRLGIDFFADTRSAELAARINQNVGGIRDLLNMTITSIARDAISLVALVGVMVFQDPLLSMIVLVVGPPMIFTVNYLMRRVRAITRESIQYNSRLIGALQEATQGIAIVKAFTMEDQLRAKLSDLISITEQKSNKIARVSERMTPISEVLAGFAIAGVIAYAGYQASVAGEPPGAVFSFIAALLLAYDPARRLARVQVNLERSLVNARMIYEILDVEPLQRDAPNAVELTVGAGDIRFDEVVFGYAPGQPVLNGISFTAAAGKTTAIVGTSGAGKSTIIALMQRFYDVWAGTISVDGQDIAQVTKQSLRRSIAYVSQQPYLFEGTIRDNIRYGRPDATDAEVEEAARLAQADDFVRALPRGYETPVGENGMTFSGGQRQRLSIARAIVRQAPILLLDEATSALDNESEAKVQKALETVMEGRTTIVIAHRLSTVVNADRILVMEAGHLIEEGTHEELLADPHGVYHRFYQMQSRANFDIVRDIPEPAPARDGRRGRRRKA